MQEIIFETHAENNEQNISIKNMFIDIIFSPYRSLLYKRTFHDSGKFTSENRYPKHFHSILFQINFQFNYSLSGRTSLHHWLTI